MQEQVAVSVIISCYNYGHLLPKALDACAAQTFRDFEIVMVNNGSSDNTEQVYQDFCRRHPEQQTTYVKVYPNNGILNGRRRGLEQAKGEFVIFCDADDWMDPDCLEKLVGTARETGADRVGGQWREISAEGKLLRERPFPKAGRFGEHKMPFGMLQCVIFRRALMESNMEFPDEYITAAEDHVISFTCFLAEKKCAFVRQTLYNYYYNQKSATGSFFRTITGEKYLQQHLPGMKWMGRLLKTGKGTTEKRSEIEYLYIKWYDLVLLRAFGSYPYREAKKIYEQMHAAIQEDIPNYLHHPWLWPFNNGYEFAPSVVIYLMCLCERLHMVWPMRLAGLASRFTYKIR